MVTNTAGDTINTDVTLTNMLSNTTYNLSAHLVNNVDLSNSTLTGISGTTRPKDFVKSNFSQNIASTTSNKLVMNVASNQNANSLNINKYEFDVVVIMVLMQLHKLLIKFLLIKDLPNLMLM